ncbi:Hypp7364 [Branchiostoma lanceolatum]|uniref:Hypp7364 protein n=1 Tax=Branchiostoma lanceolatum TaxID=7740 RepID=A0A8J9YZX7_BRALA|nr:Hypp7364 [Branchiostoma lanceolatum]
MGWKVLLLWSVLRTASSAIVISEVNADNPTIDDQEFIELFNAGSTPVSLQGFIIVLYDGATNPVRAYDVIKFGNDDIVQPKGYYVIGSAKVQPTPNKVLSTGENILENGPDAVALYYGNPADFAIGMAPRKRSLVDVVIYTKYPTSTSLVDDLAPGQRIITITNSAEDVSISACNGIIPKDWSRFTSGNPSPGRANDCGTTPATAGPPNPPAPRPELPPAPAVVISEVNADNVMVDDQEFIELYNLENRDVPLDNFVLVFFDGSRTGKAYDVIILTGYVVKAGSYFVVGSRNVRPVPDYILPQGVNILENGPDAVALYYGYFTDYSVGMSPTAENMVDVVIYSKYSSITSTPLLNVLAPGQEVVLEGAEIDPSISRCGGFTPKVMSQFRATTPTPSTANSCPSQPIPAPQTTAQPAPFPPPALLISEVNPDDPPTNDQEFIELYNPEGRGVSLDYFVLVLYGGGSSTQAYGVIPLKGYSIQPNGYFVIGSRNVQPLPDKLLDVGVNIRQSGPEAIALYYGQAADYTAGMAPTSRNLIDVIIFTKASEMSNPSLTTLRNVLAPGQDVTIRSDALDSSISRCGGLAPRDLSMFKATYSSPARINDCRDVTTPSTPTTTTTLSPATPRPNVIISEVNADNPLTDDREFIELYNQDNRAVLLDGFQLVLFDGNSMKAYEVIPLLGQTVQPNGFFTVGSGKVLPLPDILLPGEEHILQNGPDAVALYYDRSSAYQRGMDPTVVNLVDAVVYSKYSDKLDTPLASILTTGTTAILERPDIDDASISRCGGTIPRVQTMFQITYASPSELNDCRVLPTAPPTAPPIVRPTPARSPPRLLINEVNADNPRFDTTEYVEIYNPGIEKASLDSVFLVLYNGNNDRAYSVINLSGYEIQPNGYFVVGSTLVVPRPDFALEKAKNILQNGEDGVALYFNPNGDDYYQLPVTANNLIDAVVYSVQFWDGSNAILNTLTPGQQALHEYYRHNPGDMDESISRCSGNDPLRLDQFKLGFPTPGTENNCTVVPINNYPGVILSEINVDMPSVDDQEFIELYNTEDYDVILNYFVLVLYDGASSPKAYDVINLTGQRIPRKSYFVIGSSDVQPTPNVVLGKGQNILQNGPDAVALYYGSPSDFTIGMAPTNLNLVDVVIYTVYPQLVTSPLTEVLAPGQNTIIESNEAQTTDKSISRCSGLNAKDLTMFQSSAPTPGAPNACSAAQTTTAPTTTAKMSPTIAPLPNSKPIVIISEVNADNPSTDEEEFIELYNTENRAVLLDNFVIVLYEGSVLRKAYGILSLAGQAVEPHEYFVIGTENVKPKPNMVLQAGTRILQNGPDAVALYYSDPLTPNLYKLGMNPTARDLMDVVVYTKHPNVTDTPLIDVLAPGSSAVVESGIVDVSVSRCGGFVPRDISQFQATLPSPSRPNDCRPIPTPNLVINEFNADTPERPDNAEYVELYNPNDFRIPLDSVYLIFYDDDHSWAYEIIDLTGREITAKGYFVVGSKNVVPRPDYVTSKTVRLLRNREDGIGLYYNPSARYYKLMPVTTDGLVDAVVYSTLLFEGRNVILNTLTPGQQALHENKSFNAGDVDESLSRCGGLTPRELSDFTLTFPTPGRRNNCSSKAPRIVINEINVDNPSYDRKEFIELYNKESTVVSLDSVSLVLYDGNRDKVYLAINLAGYSIPGKGYFVVGTEGLRQPPDYLIDRYQNVIQNGEDAVALYYDPGGKYEKGMPVIADNLIDAVVYSTREWKGSNLILKTLTPGQKPLHESQVYYPGDIDESLSRCRGTDPVNLSQFALSVPTPGKENICDNIPDPGKTDEQTATVAPVSGAGGKVAGAVIGVLLAGVISAAAGFYIYRRRLSLPKGVKNDIKIAYRDLGYDDGTDA